MILFLIFLLPTFNEIKKKKKKRGNKVLSLPEDLQQKTLATDT